MSLLANKHFKLALVVAPLLGIVTYIGIDYSLSERPAAAAEGRSYPLAAKSNCRYESGHCTLKNGDIQLDVGARPLGKATFEVTVKSEIALQTAVLSISQDPIFPAPEAMHKLDSGGNQWRTIVGLKEPALGQMRLAVSIAGTTYFAETSAIFVEYKTAAPMPDQAQ